MGLVDRMLVLNSTHDERVVAHLQVTGAEAGDRGRRNTRAVDWWRKILVNKLP